MDLRVSASAFEPCTPDNLLWGWGRVSALVTLPEATSLSFPFCLHVLQTLIGPDIWLATCVP